MKIDHNIQRALQHVRRIFDANKSPELPQDVDHTYDDKFTVNEIVVNNTIKCIDVGMELLGVTSSSLSSVFSAERVSSKNGVLNAKIIQRSSLRSKEEKEHGVVNIVEESTWKEVLGKKISTKVSHTVTEYTWEIIIELRVYLTFGTAEIPMSTIKHTGVIKNLSEVNPRQEITEEVFKCDVHEYLKFTHIMSAAPTFKIDRTHKNCHTPLTNEDVSKINTQMEELQNWTEIVKGKILSMMNGLPKADIVNPPELDAPCILPLMPNDEISTLAASEKEYIRKVLAGFEDSDSSIVLLKRTVLLLERLNQNTQSYYSAIRYVELLLRRQLVEAIGKEVTLHDLDEYIIFHNQKLFHSDFAPRAFAVDVRVGNETPIGQITVQSDRGGDGMGLLYATSNILKETPPVRVSISASSDIVLEGTHYLHGSIAQCFSTSGLPQSVFKARARQFSSFILMVGTMTANDRFKANHAMIIQNKDEFNIPLEFETIPTAQEFRAAISSMSPEQQAFAKAIRELQLSSTIFSFCVVEIKPQLEAVLRLPYGSLTKEIELNENLMTLFCEYQVPSELLQYDGPESASLENKLTAVKSAVEAIMQLISNQRKKEISERTELAKLQKLENESDYSESMDFSIPILTKKAAPMMVRTRMMPSISGSARMTAQHDFVAPNPSGMIAPQHVAAPPPRPISEPQAIEKAKPEEGGNDILMNQADSWEVTDQFESYNGPFIDFTNMPNNLEKILEKNSCGSIRPTIIKLGKIFSKKEQKGLIGKVEISDIAATEQKTEKQRAMDLLDALSRSGGLPMKHCQIHVLIMNCQCFDDTLVDTVISKNTNPIVLIERSTLVMSQVIHGVEIKDLVKDSAKRDLIARNPDLL